MLKQECAFLGMLYERVNDSPVLASKDYKTQYDKPIVPSEDNEWVWMEFFGSGVHINEHPLESKCNMYGCGECKSDNVQVIYGKWCVSVHSGDAYWDYEVACSDCGKYTARSFSEND